jgi:hypothetical protein
MSLTFRVRTVVSRKMMGEMMLHDI